MRCDSKLVGFTTGVNCAMGCEIDGFEGFPDNTDTCPELALFVTISLYTHFT